MTLIVCVDDRLGMMFNHRRQSRDREVIRRILDITKGHTLWVSPYSAPLFEGAARTDAQYAQQAGKDDFCFVEDGDLPLEHADRVILYRWNRTYPADRRFPADPTALGFHPTHTEEFVGFSHETITEEVFVKHEQA